MSENDKELLLKDLCNRLPYGVKVKHEAQDFPSTLLWVDSERLSAGRKADKIGVGSDWGNIEFIKPYLRPMSSMTEGEKEELTEEHKKDERIYIDVIERVANGDKHARGTAIPHFAADWCNEHHFDYRGLIEKGLAIEVTEENNPYKE